MSSGYKIVGTAAGTPVVCLHSSMSSHRQFSSFAMSMADERQLIMIDLYGYGSAPPAPGERPHSLQLEVERVLGILRSLDVVHFDLVGHSFGGACALLLAAQHSARVGKLALYEPVAFHLLPASHPVRNEVIALAGQMHGVDAAQAAGVFLDYWNGTGFFAQLPEKIRQQFTAQVAKVELDFEALIGASLTASDLRTFHVPTLLLCGRQSQPSAHAVAEQINAHAPAVELRWIDAGHMAPVTHPDLVNPHWQAFLQSEQ